MSVEILTREDLEKFKVELLQELKSLMQTQPETKRLLKSKDVRKMFDISAGTLQTLRINGTLPYSKVGGSIYYEYAEVIKILNQNKQNKPNKQNGKQ